MSEPPSAQPGPDPAAGPASPDTTLLPSLGPRGEGWFLLQVLFMIAVLIAGAAAGSHWTGAPRFALSVLGGVLFVSGAALAILGIKDLDRSMSPMPRPTETAVLIQDGVYRRLRHPIYAALILIGIGWSLLFASLLALVLALVLAGILDLKARREEVWLRARYPGYSDYAAHTKRFVPGVY